MASEVRIATSVRESSLVILHQRQAHKTPKRWTPRNVHNRQNKNKQQIQCDVAVNISARRVKWRVNGRQNKTYQFHSVEHLPLLIEFLHVKLHRMRGQNRKQSVHTSKQLTLPSHTSYWLSACSSGWVQQSFVRNNVSACCIKHVYHDMFRLKSKPSSVIVYRILTQIQRIR
jgi:hypothetical protein